MTEHGYRDLLRQEGDGPNGWVTPKPAHVGRAGLPKINQNV